MVAPGLSVTSTIKSGGLSVAVTAVTNIAAPVITSALTATGYVGAAFSYQAAATNSPAGYMATALPAGLVVDASSGLIPGEPAQTGVYNVILSATNAGGSGTASLTLTVSAALAPGTPVITSAVGTTGQVGATFSYQITASNTPTNYSATGLPGGLSVNAADGLIIGTPTKAGAFAVTLGVANAIGKSTLAMAVTITPALPVVTLSAAVPSVIADSGQIGEFLLTVPSASASNLAINYSVKGTTVNGADYTLLSGIKTLKTSKPIKIIPEGNLGGAPKKTVKLVLEPGTGYTVGTTGKVKVTILATP